MVQCACRYEEETCTHLKSGNFTAGYQRRIIKNFSVKSWQKQELDDTTPYFAIPQEILDFYKMYRPSPLVRAYCLEKSWVLRHIFIKFEGNNTSGSHKLNSAIAQAYYAKESGLKGGYYGNRCRAVGTAPMACPYLDLTARSIW